MSKKNFIEACREHTNYTVATSRATFNLFCEILGYPKSAVHHFIGDDPHGVVDIMEGYRVFNMTDIHVVISEYEHWMEIYKTNEELRKAVDAWYYYCQEWHEKNSLEEPRWVSVKDRLPDGKEVLTYKLVDTSDGVNIARYDKSDGKWKEFGRGSEINVGHWMNLPTFNERSKGCPNLRSWLAGCPVDGLREATPEWKEEQRKAQEAAHQRVEECKQALEDAIKEEVKLNKF